MSAIALPLAGLLALLTASPTQAQYTLRTSHYGASHTTMSGGSYALRAAAGQPGMRILGDGAPYYLGTGFWFAVRNENVALPVELAAFKAVRATDRVVLTWATESEINNAGFEIERKVEHGDGHKVAWKQIGFAEGAGTTSQPQTYRFADANPPFSAEVLVYRLKQIDLNGAFEYSSEVEVALEAPDQVALHGNYPNPFRHQTTIRYEVPQAGPVRLSVHDILGRQVAVLVDGKRFAGQRAVTFMAGSLPSGVYFMQLQAGAKTITRKLTIIR